MNEEIKEEQYKEERIEKLKKFVLLESKKLNQEQSKLRLDGHIDRHIKELRGVMHEVVQEVVESVRIRALRVLDPTAEIEQEIKELDDEIRMLENGKPIVHGLAARSAKDYYDEAIIRLEKKVRSIRERPELNINVEEMIPFDRDNIMEAMLKTVSIVGEPSTKMITYDKLIDLERPSVAKLIPQVAVPWGAATFQT